MLAILKRMTLESSGLSWPVFIIFIDIQYVCQQAGRVMPPLVTAVSSTIITRQTQPGPAQDTFYIEMIETENIENIPCWESRDLSQSHSGCQGGSKNLKVILFEDQ